MNRPVKFPQLETARPFPDTFSSERAQPVRCVYSIRSPHALVLMQQSAETVATFQRYRFRRRPRRR
jgi:hypothetical protein